MPWSLNAIKQLFLARRTQRCALQPRARLRLECLEDRTVPSAIIYVNQAATGANNGTDWTDADTNLQSALSAATSGDQIWVAAGAYYPTSTGNRAASFNLPSGVGIYGGFVGDETALSQRNFVANPTILSGAIGTPSNYSYHVVYAYAVTGTTLDGFTITGGNADAPSSVFLGDDGGGLMLWANTGLTSNLTLNNLTFAANTATYGGGMCCSNVTPVMSNVAFSNNAASYGGGGMASIDSTPKMQDVSFSTNRAPYGAGMYNDASNAVITSSTFTSNTAKLSGGGMFNWNSVPMLTFCSFSTNVAYSDGGGMYNYDAAPNISGMSAFTGNTAMVGGGMYNYGLYGGRSSPYLFQVSFSSNQAVSAGAMANYFCAPSLTNVLFWNNGAQEAGAMYDYASTPGLENDTLGGNYANVGAAIFNDLNSRVALVNDIVWANTSKSGSQIVNNSTSMIAASYSILAGAANNATNHVLNANPLFVNLAQGNLELSAGSPAIGAGASKGAPSVDLLGNPRPTATGFDLGCYQYETMS